MGGLLILTGALVPTLLWADLTNVYLWIAMVSTLAFGSIGFADDYLKIVRQSHHGLLPRYKLMGQFVVALLVGLTLLVLAHYNLYNTRLIFPFFKRLIPDLGWWYLPFTVVILVGWSNAVNLTDGLDGLAISTFAIFAATFTALSYVTGHRVLAQYLNLVHFETAELTIFCGSLVGASLGFLWYNSYPAEIFMGDVGSLALGGALATVAILIKQELLLHIVGGVLVLEAASVIIQVASFKMTASASSNGAAASSLRAIGWSEPEGHYPVHHRGHHFRVVQSHHVEAALMAITSFSVEGRKVAVVGAARSGVAAALLLAGRGAQVTLTDVRPAVDRAGR